MPEASTRMRTKIEFFFIGVESNVCHLRQNILDLSFLLYNSSPSETLIKSNATEKKYLPHIFFPVYSYIHFVDSPLGNGPSGNQQAYSWIAKERNIL